jgi:hypothetical protein
MAYKMKGFGGFGNSPAKQTKFPDSPGAKKRKLKKENKAMEELGEWPAERKEPSPQSPEMIEKRKKDFDKKSKDPNYTWGKSPAKQEGPIPKENIKLQKGEMEGTWIYGRGYDDEEIGSQQKDEKKYGKKFVNRERIADLEDRVEFTTSDAEEATGERKKQLLATAKKLQHEADILRNRKTK